MPEGDHALSNVERQARYRARLAASTAPTHRRHSSTDRRSRPQRWRDAVAELLALLAEYAGWLETLPESLRDSTTAEALAAITDFDLEALADIEPPKGYGRD